MYVAEQSGISLTTIRLYEADPWICCRRTRNALGPVYAELAARSSAKR